jgi:hypothetical protein
MYQKDQRRSRTILYAIGTVVGGVAITLTARYFSYEYQMSVVTSTFTKVMDDMQKSAAKTGEKIQRDAAAARQAAIDKEERDRQIVAQAERDKFAKQQAAIDAASRAADAKEAAWKQFYQPSSNCQSYESRASMECANEHVRAKRDFEAKWAAGQL